jgi:hypothetical protein
MKNSLLAASAMLLAVTALAPVAWAEGPRASSENNWPGIASADSAAPPVANGAAPSAPEAARHYVWQEGYENGGKWHGHWILVP